MTPSVKTIFALLKVSKVSMGYIVHLVDLFFKKKQMKTISTIWTDGKDKHKRGDIYGTQDHITIGSIDIITKIKEETSFVICYLWKVARPFSPRLHCDPTTRLQISDHLCSKCKFKLIWKVFYSKRYWNQILNTSPPAAQFP